MALQKWDVNYDGWVTVEAETEEQALEKANKLLSNTPNDGKTSEWYLLSTQKAEED